MSLLLLRCLLQARLTEPFVSANSLCYVLPLRRHCRALSWVCCGVFGLHAYNRDLCACFPRNFAAKKRVAVRVCVLVLLPLFVPSMLPFAP